MHNKFRRALYLRKGLAGRNVGGKIARKNICGIMWFGWLINYQSETHQLKTFVFVLLISTFFSMCITTLIVHRMSYKNDKSFSWVVAVDFFSSMGHIIFWKRIKRWKKAHQCSFYSHIPPLFFFHPFFCHIEP